MSKELLFEGEPELLGGLSNEDELDGLCPKEFRRRNRWSEYASKLFFCGANISNWKWKSENDEEKRKQLNCFSGLLSSFSISHQGKEAVAGWMLSEMLSEVPEHLPKSSL